MTNGAMHPFGNRKLVFACTFICNPINPTTASVSWPLSPSPYIRLDANSIDSWSSLSTGTQ